MCYKHKVLDVFLNRKKMIKTMTSRMIKQLKSDNCSGYKSDLFMNMCWKRYYLTLHCHNKRMARLAPSMVECTGWMLKVILDM